MHLTPKQHSILNYLRRYGKHCAAGKIGKGAGCTKDGLASQWAIGGLNQLRDMGLVERNGMLGWKITQKGMDYEV